MMSNIHVSGLSYFCTDEELRQTFAPFGTVVFAQVLRDSFGHALGLGIVHMSRCEEVANIFNAQQHFTMSGMHVDIWEPSDSDTAPRREVTPRRMKGVLIRQPIPRVKRSRDANRLSGAVRTIRPVGFVLYSV